jgi:hypothetical protein
MDLSDQSKRIAVWSLTTGLAVAARHIDRAGPELQALTALERRPNMTTKVHRS